MSPFRWVLVFVSFRRLRVRPFNVPQACIVRRLRRLFVGRYHRRIPFLATAIRRKRKVPLTKFPARDDHASLELIRLGSRTRSNCIVGHLPATANETVVVLLHEIQCLFSKCLERNPARSGGEWQSGCGSWGKKRWPLEPILWCSRHLSLCLPTLPFIGCVYNIRPILINPPRPDFWLCRDLSPQPWRMFQVPWSGSLPYHLPSFEGQQPLIRVRGNETSGYSTTYLMT